MAKIREGKPLRKTTIDIPVELYKELQLVVTHKYNGTYGHIGESIAEGIKLWIKENKKVVANLE